MPILLYNSKTFHPVLIATSTIALQEQLLSDMELLKNAEPVKDYGEFSFFPVYGGKLKKYRVEIKR